CNALQATMGMFLHSCNAPEKIINVLARVGLSIGASSIHRGNKSLSKESASLIRQLAQEHPFCIGYDNLDFKFNTSAATIDSPGEGLVHFTTASMFLLEHGVTREDLRCAAYIWNRQDIRLNPRATDPHTFSTRPLRALDINPGSVGGNIQALEELSKQCGYGDPRNGLHDPEDHVTVTFGDLGTFEHELSAQKQRSVEKSPLQRLEHIVPAPSGFHIKMAAIDACWRALVKPAGKNARVVKGDETHFMRYLQMLRPNDTGRLASKPKFREQHELLDQVGTMLRLDAWRSAVLTLYHGKYQSLEEFAESRPTLDALRGIADHLAQHFVAGESDADVDDVFVAPAEEDEQFTNTRLTHTYLLLYEELSRSMNDGDVGRFETVVPAWCQIFRSTGKHKYANRLLLFMHNLYVIYPERLRQCIRYNMFVNPTGKPHQFRAVDWVIELQNLYTKTMYSGEGSNHTKSRLISESPLILTYRSSHANFERNFQLPGLTTRHGKKDMTEPYSRLSKHMAKHNPNSKIRGRKSLRKIENKILLGAALILAEDKGYIVAKDGD
ncbi:hypothetical protein PHLGIDRAFT_41918, partial [Phlebiopsis gigantea 11061_1 CR5-6]